MTECGWVDTSLLMVTMLGSRLQEMLLNGQLVSQIIYLMAMTWKVVFTIGPQMKPRHHL